MAIDWEWGGVQRIRSTKDLFKLGDTLNTKFAELSASLANTSAGSGGVPGLTLARSTGGLLGNGSADDAPALHTLANTTLQPFGGTIYCEPGLYRLATPCFIPGNITLCLPRTAVMVVDGTALTHTGSLTAGLYQFFKCVNGGLVRFHNDKSWQSAVAFIDGAHPEWFGGMGDGVAFDDDAMDLVVESLRGWPQTPLSSPSWARGEVRLRPGGKYLRKRKWRVFEAAVGGAIRGGGAENTQIIYRNADSRKKFAAVAYPATNLVAMATIPAGDLVGKWLLPAGPTHLGWEGGTQPREIVEQDGEILRTNGHHGYTDPTNTFYILDACLLDISGSFNLRSSGFTVTTDGGAQGSAAYSGVFYHRDARRTARGSSKGGFTDVNCDAKTAYANFAIGSFIPGQQNWQEDLATFWHCHAFGLRYQYADDSDEQKLWSQRGWRFGSNLFANPLNYTANGCVSIGFNYGVMVSASNLTWDGGTVQTNEWNYAVSNGLQASISIRGPRSESARGFLFCSSAQSVYFSIELSHMEFRGENLTRIPGTGYCQFIRGVLSGSLKLHSIRVPNPPEVLGGPSVVIPAGGIGPNYIDTGIPMAVDEYVGASCSFRGPPMTPEFKGIYSITSNTAEGRLYLDVEDMATNDTFQRTVPIAGTDCYIVSLTPVIEAADSVKAYIKAEDCGFHAAVPFDQMVRLHRTYNPPLQQHYTANPNITVRAIDVIPLDADGAPIKGFEGARGTASQNNVHRIVPNDHGVRSDAWQGSGIKPFYHYRGEHQRVLVIGAYTLTLGGLTAGNVYVPDPFPGQRLTIELEQDGNGPHPIIWQTGEKAPLRWTPGPPPEGPAGSITVCELYFNGTAWLGRWSLYA